MSVPANIVKPPEEHIMPGLPEPQGLYHPSHEHDACGIGFVANIKGQKSHDIIEKGIQIPHKFFAREAATLGFTLPATGEYGIGMVFLPVEPHQRLQTEGIIERIVQEEGLRLLGWRDTPIDGTAIGRIARGTQPYIEQIFVGRGEGMSTDQLERKFYVVRKRAEAEVAATDMADRGMFSIPSLSARTIVYKGLLLAPQIANFYKELSDSDVTSALCLVHQRFSTNTFPPWHLAHPFHYVAHNGEINTVKGNVNWMHARQTVLQSDLFGGHIEKVFPVIQPNGSDS